MGMEYTNNTINKLYEDNKGFLANIIFDQRIKSYFDIEQKVVFDKLKFMVFPFKSLIQREEDLGNREDKYITKAEFYLPCMALVSFVLISCFKVILNDQEFEPSKIVNRVSSCLLISILESLLVKIAFIMAVGVSLPFLDVTSFICYKYTG